MPANHNLDEYLEAYIKGVDLEADPKGPLFRTAVGKSEVLTQLWCKRGTSGSAVRQKIRWHAFCRPLPAISVCPLLQSQTKIAFSVFRSSNIRNASAA